MRHRAPGPAAGHQRRRRSWPGAPVALHGRGPPLLSGPMTYRVIQWATGNVGRAAVEGIVAHPDLELIGAWVHSPDKAGRDVGELCGIGPLGVVATGDEDHLLALDADCVLYSPLLPDTAQVIRILESGKNVVTPLGWFYPFVSIDVAAIEAACRRGGATLHGTGIHPGGITERF